MLWALLLTPSIMLGGCGNAAEQLYTVAVIGQPLPSTLPAGTEVYGYGACVRAKGGAAFPGVERVVVARLLKNEKGIIVAKSLLTKETNQWQGFFGGTDTYVTEVLVPEELFSEPPGGWTELMTRIAEATSGYRLGSASLALSDMEEKERPQWIRFPPRDLTLGELASACVSGQYGLGAYLVVASKQNMGPPPDALKPISLPAYLAFTEELLTLLPESTQMTRKSKFLDADITWTRTTADSRGSVHPVYQLAADYPQAFSDLTRPGFKWQGGRHGTTLKTENFGDRHIRIETRVSAAEQMRSLADEPE
jgi:hypothetical protein